MSADPLTLFARHIVRSVSSRNSHARARLQRRFKVAGEMSSAAAASSMLRPAEKPQLDDARLLGIDGFEPRQRFIERGKHGVLGCGGDERLDQRHAIQPAPPL